MPLTSSQFPRSLRSSLSRSFFTTHNDSDVAEQRLRKLRNRLTAVVKDNPELLSADTEKIEEEEDIVGRSELSPLRLTSRLRRSPR
ncbi:hypothetical protein F2Q70_00030299 [Brassica cretica]|uniref:Uncharacterized protein n=1 Tax=Brassica cretica TaxID=69181 RepID=A0A8S9FL91_BRACR|nr:hypothetical protein F2Q70_00030299 [Brassica cretica]